MKKTIIRAIAATVAAVAMIAVIGCNDGPIIVNGGNNCLKEFLYGFDTLVTKEGNCPQQ